MSGPWAKVLGAVDGLPGEKKRFISKTFRGYTSDTHEPCACVARAVAEELGMPHYIDNVLAYVEAKLDVPDEVVRELVQINDRAPFPDTWVGCKQRYEHVRAECARRAEEETNG